MRVTSTCVTMSSKIHKTGSASTKASSLNKLQIPDPGSASTKASNIRRHQVPKKAGSVPLRSTSSKGFKETSPYKSPFDLTHLTLIPQSPNKVALDLKSVGISQSPCQSSFDLMNLGSSQSLECSLNPILNGLWNLHR